MPKLKQTLRLLLAVFFAVFSSGLTQLYTAPNAAAAPDDKVTICSRTDSATNPYTEIVVAKPAAYNHYVNHINGNVGVYPDASWGDIIEPFTIEEGQNAGTYSLNYYLPGTTTPDPDTQLLITNNCSTEGIETLPSTATASKTVCTAGVVGIDKVSLTVANTNDIMDYTGTYEVLVNGVAYPISPNTVLDGQQKTWNLSLSAGTHRVIVKETLNGITSTLSDSSVTVNTCEEIVIPPVIPTVVVSDEVCDSSEPGVNDGEAVVNVDRMSTTSVNQWRLSLNGTVIKTGSFQTGSISAAFSWSDLGNGSYTFAVIADGEVAASADFIITNCSSEEDVPPLPATPPANVCEMILTGRTIWAAGAGGVTERDKYGEGGEVNADGWGNYLRLYGATDKLLKNVNLTFTPTQGFSFTGAYNTVATPGAGNLQGSGYTYGVEDIQIFFRDGKFYVTIAVMPAGSSFSFNAAINRSADTTLYMDSIMRGEDVSCSSTPGMGGGPVETPPTPVITPAKATLPVTLPTTGANTDIKGVFYALIAAIVVYGAVYFGQPKRLFDSQA